MKPFATGLIVGKFSPLHQGHEALINKALEACNQLVVVSYSLPEFAGFEAARRKDWLERRFPQVESVVITPEDAQVWGIGSMPDNDSCGDLHRHFVASLCQKHLHIIPDVVFTAEDYGDGFAQVLSSRFGHKVAHVRLQRESGPEAVSGTLLRSDIHRYRRLMDPGVYSDFVHRICLIGGESTGKSTLSAALARSLNTLHVAEYGREHWEQKRGNLSFDDMLVIAQTQVMREMTAHPNRYLVCDTSPLTTLFYSLEMFDKADPQLERLAQRQYDTVVLCADDFEFVQDGTRQGEAFSQRQKKWYIRELTKRNISYLLVNGSVDQRVALILKHLGHTVTHH